MELWKRIDMDGEPENNALRSHTTIYTYISKKMYEVIGLVFTCMSCVLTHGFLPMWFSWTSRVVLIIGTVLIRASIIRGCKLAKCWCGEERRGEKREAGCKLTTGLAMRTKQKKFMRETSEPYINDKELTTIWASWKKTAKNPLFA
jgi:hypothetical protein